MCENEKLELKSKEVTDKEGDEKDVVLALKPDRNLYLMWQEKTIAVTTDTDG